MPQITIYLNEQAAARAREGAKAAGLSVSRWIAERVDDRGRDRWSDEVLALAGTWKDEDFPSAEEIRASHPPDRVGKKGK
jgi:hypothetical protein